jgi:hypothetical protein
MQDIQEKALSDAWFYASLVEDFKSYALSRIFAKSDFRETINDPTWLHIYPENSKIANLAVSEFDTLACLFATRCKYVGLRVFSGQSQV